MAEGVVAITAGSGTPIRVLTGLGPNSAGQQVFTHAGADGVLSPTDPDGTLQVSPEPSTLLLDDFTAAITANFTTGGTAPATSGGVLTTSEGTTASAISYVRSTLPYYLRAGTYLVASFNLTIETAATANNSRWWGYGQNQTTPTATAPVLNGTVFQLDSAAGALQAVTYSAGTKNVVATLTRPSDGLPHRYVVLYRQSQVYWVIDGVTVASKAQPVTAVGTGMYAIIGAANTATAPSAHTFSLTSAAIADQAAMNKTISDGINPGLQATVKAPASLATSTIAATDNPLLTQALPTSSINATTLGAAATAISLTLGAPGAGLRHYITGIWFERYISTATTGAATQINSTSTNSTIVFSLPFDTQAVGTVNFPVAITFSSPIPAISQNTATVFTVPAVTGTNYRISVSYFIAP